MLPRWACFPRSSCSGLNYIHHTTGRKHCLPESPVFSLVSFSLGILSVYYSLSLTLCLIGWAPSDDWKDIQRVLIHASAKETALRKDQTLMRRKWLASSPLASDPAFLKWRFMTTTQGRPLVIYGQSHEDTLHVANHAIQTRVSDEELARDGKEGTPDIFSFEFDRYDPLRNSAEGMLISLIARMLGHWSSIFSRVYETLDTNLIIGRLAFWPIAVWRCGMRASLIHGV